jgi:hypothetical protein
MIEQGPVAAIVKGQSGAVEEFMTYFGNKTSPEEAAIFLHALHERYGELKRGSLDGDIDPSPVESDNLFLGLVPVQAELQYLLVFEDDKIVILSAHYELFKDVNGGDQFTNRFAWIEIQDEDDGHLVYPAHVKVEDTAVHGQ